MNKPDLALNNLQLICHKTKPNQSKLFITDWAVCKNKKNLKQLHKTCRYKHTVNVIPKPLDIK